MEEKKQKPIDFSLLAKQLWKHRKLYWKVLPATLVVTYLLTVCVPRYYRCSVSLAPEISSPSMSGSLGSIASSIGLGSSLAKMASQDAIYAEIYPDVLGSKDFMAELMTVEVETKKGDVKTNYYSYLCHHQKAAWWNEMIGTVIGWFSSEKGDGYDGTKKLSVFNLTKQQDDVFNAAIGKIKCGVDKKTDVVSITVTDQDPLVCAMIANATCQKLQAFIIDYRTNKARIDHEFYEKLCNESKAAYDKARQDYARFADSHQNIVLASYQTQIEALENEMQLKYNAYTMMNTQLQAAAARLQEATPAFTVIQAASVPVKPAGPKRMFISIGMMMLAFFVLSGWLIIKENRPDE